MKNYPLSPNRHVSKPRVSQAKQKPTISQPVPIPQNENGIQVLQGSLSRVQAKADRIKKQQIFPIPQIEIWEQALNSHGLPIQHGKGQTQAILLNGKDLFQFCREHNNGNPIARPGQAPQAISPWRSLLEQFLPELRTHRKRNGVKQSIHRRDKLIKQIKQFTATQNNIPLETLQLRTATGKLTQLKI